jgi:hypothetical protein
VLFLNLAFLTIEYIFACLGMGYLIWQVPRMRDTGIRVSSGIKLTTSFLLGLGILANLWLLIALSGWFSPVVVRITSLLLAIIGIATHHKIIPEFLHKAIEIIVGSFKSRWGWKLVFSLTILLCLGWATSLGRSPFGDGSDFYLAIAKVIASSHQLRPLPGYEEFTSIGLQGEMHFAALMSLGSVDAAQLFPWPVTLAGAMMFVALAGRAGLGRHGQWLVLTMLFTSSALIELSGSGKIDLFATALGFAAYYWAVRVRDTEGTMAIWLAGIFMGLALLAKISYILTFIPSVTIIILWGLLSKDPQTASYTVRFRRSLPLVLVCIAGFLISVTPHLLKNHVLFENSFAPFGTGTTGFKDQTWYGPETIRRILLTLPLALTFGEYWAQLGNLSPLVLAFSPLLPYIPRSRPLLNSLLFILTISAMTGMLCWFVLRPSVLAPRYFMACLFLLLIPVAAGAEAIVLNQARSEILNNIIISVTILTILATGTYHLDRVFFPHLTYRYLIGEASRCEKEPEYCRTMTVNSLAGPGTRVFMDNYLRYWLRPDLIQCALTREEIRSYIDLETPQQRWSFIYGRGFELIPIFNIPNRAEVLVRADMEHLPDWLQVVEVKNGSDVLLQLTSTDESHKPLVGCKQTTPPAWDLFNIISS